MELNLSYMSISDLLEKAAEKNELIYVRERQRCLGKTTALIQFARENNSPILTNRAMANHYKELHPDLTFIGYWKGIELSAYENLVCDELVPFEVAKELHESGHLLTGFVRKPFPGEKSFSSAKRSTSFIHDDESILTFRKIEQPFLQIEVDDVDSAPRIFYKGEKIEGIINADFSYLTNTELINPTHIDIEYVDEDSKFGTKAIVHNRHLVSERRLSTGEKLHGSSL
ncbi:hypothetical protein [Bacillus subtilis]|uniref:hypothetical protein n=1 Tax=Bacillus subtilis TaxID=1423 RepID=UPI001009B45F|nr:hypothetical protein [Bacillus subtilis]QAW18051.1 hypothetical protein ETA19_17005 [Bacillus subtilis]QAW22125.1 hypothetical protein ETA18_17005 [Bacillus subtilis]